MENSSDNIGNRTRDLPACSAVPPRAPLRNVITLNCPGAAMKTSGGNENAACLILNLEMKVRG
jgi:hypothetical protein